MYTGIWGYGITAPLILYLSTRLNVSGQLHVLVA